MAGQQKELDANEPATPFKLEKAHERGSIFKSGDVTFAFVLLACVACIYGLGMQLAERTALLIRRGLPFIAREDLSATSARAYMHEMSSYAIAVIAPALLSVWMVALVVAALQARGVFSAHPLKPDFSRLNPANGVKRLLSVRSLHELWRSGAKMAVITIAMAAWLRHHIGDLLSLATRSVRAAARGGIELLGSAMILLAAIVLVFALLEWRINRWEYLRKMRMSKREIKDEHKEREGDPRIKRRLRELRLQWLKRSRQVAKVRSADVLLTNPTHYAVALEYRHGEMPAPIITARGAGEMARRMRLEARRRGVPVVENAPLARALYALKESQALVPEEHFDQVARVLRWVYAARDAQGAGRSFA